MKRILPIILTIVLATQFLLLSACVITPNTQPDAEPDVQPITFQVTYTAGNGGSILGQAEQTVKKGNDATSVYALADIGYTFEKWSDGLTTPGRQDCNVQANINLTATFTKESFDTPKPNPPGTFDLDYKYGVVDNPIEKVTFVKDEVSETDLPVPTREHFTFGGWYVGETQVTDEQGNVLVGNEIFDIEETVIYAKWTANETHTFKALIIYVTSVEAHLYTEEGSEIDVNYKMSAAEERLFHATTKRLDSYCDEMLDGLVDFQFDEYFTTQTITEENIVQVRHSDGTYITVLEAYYIPEVLGMLSDYDSYIVVFGLRPQMSLEDLFFGYQGIAGARYGQVCLDSKYNTFFAYDITLEEMTEALTQCVDFERYGMANMVYCTWLDTFIHEMGHTIQMRFGGDTLHEALGTTTFKTSPIKMKAFYLNESVVDGKKAGIPYDVWARNFARITISVNDKTRGYVMFDGYYGGGTYIDPANNLIDKYYEAIIGQEITISAKPWSRYKFASWSDGDTNPTRTITITEDLDLTAIFEPAEYTVNVNSSEGDSIYGYCDGSTGVGHKTVYLNNQSLTDIVKLGISQTLVSARADDCCRFVGWFDGATNYERNFDFYYNRTFIEWFDETIR